MESALVHTSSKWIVFSLNPFTWRGVQSSNGRMELFPCLSHSVWDSIGTPANPLHLDDGLWLQVTSSTPGGDGWPELAQPTCHKISLFALQPRPSFSKDVFVFSREWDNSLYRGNQDNIYNKGSGWLTCLRCLSKTCWKTKKQQRTGNKNVSS